MCPNSQLAGLHSRSEDLIELTRSYDRGRASWAEVENGLRLDTSELVQLQDRLGFEYVSDGALFWQDQLRPVTQSLTGISVGTRYSRWFDTNTFYQKPTVTGKISLGDFKTENFLQLGILPRHGKWKVSIPGPYTFVELSENKHYRDRDELVRDVAQAEREIVKRLAQAGVSLVQLSEPCLVYRPYREEVLGQLELDGALQGIGHVARGSEAKILVQTFFGDATQVLPRLLELPVSAVGFDLYETDCTTFEERTAKELVLGIVDARESNIEDPNWIAETAASVRKHLETPTLSLAPNSDLKFLPRSAADKKLTALAQGAKILEELN